MPIAETQATLFDTPPPEPEPEKIREPGAHTVVAAFVDSYRRHHSGGDPVKRDIGRVARDAKAILGARRATVEELTEAATLTGSGPYSNLGVSLNIQRDRGGRRQGKTLACAPPARRDDPGWNGWEEENAARAAEIAAEDPEIAAWLAGGSLTGDGRPASDVA